MKAATQLTAQARGNAGTGPARALRRDGRSPGIIYGAGMDAPVQISLEARELEKEYHKGFFFNKLAEITVDGKAYHVLPKDLQLHPVTDFIEHADFYSVTKDSRVNVQVPVKFLNQDRCIGIKRGGALNVVRHDIELVCSPEAIPMFIKLDLKEAQIGDSLHISQVTLPEGVEPAITDRDFTIATIAGRLAQVEEPAAEAASEGEEGAEDGAAEGKEGDAKADEKSGE